MELNKLMLSQKSEMILTSVINTYPDPTEHLNLYLLVNRVQ